MRNKQRAGFTLMEIVLVMVLIAILATGVAIGFTSYINRGHETGITTDYNSTFKNPVRMTAIEKGRLTNLAELKETVISDGFTPYVAENWQLKVTETAAIDLSKVTGGQTFGVEKGNKRYQVLYMKDAIVKAATTTPVAAAVTADAIIVRADHSNKNSAVMLYLNPAKNDIVSVLGTATAAGVFTAETK